MGGGGKLKSSFKTSPIFTFTDKVLAQDFNCKAHFKRGLKKGFTLAEVLITLAIIGVVAAMTIPAVIVNTNQAEFKTGLRKAVSVLNSAITLNKALTGESPYDNRNLYKYLQQYMAIMSEKTNSAITYGEYVGIGGALNAVFYTTDGMRYEIATSQENNYDFKLYDNNKISANIAPITITGYFNKAGFGDGNGCGSLGLAHNPDGTTEPPCIITVDVNGDRKPNPATSFNYHPDGVYFPDYPIKLKKANPNGKLLTDMFSIMITDQGAIPYGVVAQKAMYQAQK